MQKIWPLEVLSLIVPTKNILQTLFLTKQSQAQTNCDQTKNYTLLFNQNPKKIKNVWLSNLKGLLNFKLVVILPRGTTPKPPYPLPLPSPFHAQVRFPHTHFLLCNSISLKHTIPLPFPHVGRIFTYSFPIR
jgi:hypothetical protein